MEPLRDKIDILLLAFLHRFCSLGMSVIAEDP